MNANLAEYAVSELDMQDASVIVGGDSGPVGDAVKELLVYAGKCIINNWDAFTNAFSQSYDQY